MRGNAPFAAASHCKRGEDDDGEEDGNQAHLLVYESGAAPGPPESQAFHIKPLGVAAAALTIVAYKQGFSAQGDSRSRTGRQALCSQDLTATFQPDCTPPMTVEFSNVVVTVTAADGTFLQFTF